MDIKVHPRVRTYIIESGEKETLIAHLKQLQKDPYHKRAEVDIKN